jgi:HD superfamily phosphohydrolase YqeK
VRYYFDLRDIDGLFSDKAGTELSTLAAAREEAALTLAGLAHDTLRKLEGEVARKLAIEVRDETVWCLRLGSR